MKLLSPCHNAPVYIFEVSKEDAPIICCPRCDNEWDVDGEPV